MCTSKMKKFLIIIILWLLTTCAGLPFECPKDVCTCGDSDEKWTIQCPYLSIEGSEDLATMRCERQNPDVYAFIPPISLPEITMFEFLDCPLGVSFQAILDLMNITNVHFIDFQSSQQGITFHRSDFDGLEQLQKLVIKTDTEEHFPYDLLDSLTDLKVLQIESQHAEFPIGFFTNARNLQALELALQLRTIEPEILDGLQNVKMLSLHGNRLRKLTKETMRMIPNVRNLELSGNQFDSFNRDVFTPLRELESIHLNSNRFTSLPARLFANNRQLKEVKLVQDEPKLAPLPGKFFGGFESLERVHVTGQMSEISEDLFEGSYNIIYINLEANNLEALPVKLLRDQRNLRELNLRFNGLVVLQDEFLENAISLEILRLSNNRISKITDKTFVHQRHLVELFLDFNNLQTIQPGAFRNLRSLEILELQHNQLTLDPIRVNSTGPPRYEEVRVFSTLPALRVLNLKHNQITRILQDWRSSSLNLEELDLSYNHIKHIRDGTLHFLQENVDIYLQHNYITTINVHPFEYSGLRVHLGENPLECDCHIFDFVLDINSFDVIDLHCAGPKYLHGIPLLAITPHNLTCPLEGNLCPAGCDCQVRPDDYTLLMNCRNLSLMETPSLAFVETLNLDRVELDLTDNFISKLPTQKDPGYQLISVLNVERNVVRKISSENIPKQIESLRLSGNELKMIDGEVIDLMNARFNATMSLASNDWICNCSTVAFREFAFAHAANILDWDDVQCVDGRLLSRLGAADFCQDDLTIYFVIIVVASVTILILGCYAMFLIYNQEIKVWLFARGWCRCLIKEDELDENKKNDAFISFAQEDVGLVTEHLVPQLETGEFPYKLCIHERDWNAGELIGDQVRRSVEESRRTIVILSKHFVGSAWGRAEFDEAHTLGQKEGLPRLIVILYDEDSSLDMKNLPENIQTYVNTNTYLKWGDPGFWPKLRYALRKPISQTRGDPAMVQGDVNV